MLSVRSMGETLRQSHPRGTREACPLPCLLGSARAPDAEQGLGVGLQPQALTPAARTGPQTQTGNPAVGSHGPQFPETSRCPDLALVNSGKSKSLRIQVLGGKQAMGRVSQAQTLAAGQRGSSSRKHGLQPPAHQMVGRGGPGPGH